MPSQPFKKIQHLLTDGVMMKWQDYGDCNGSKPMIEFVKNFVMPHINSSIILQHLSDIYVLVLIKASEGITRDGEVGLKDILSKDQYKLLNDNNHFIVGFMMINKTAFYGYKHTDKTHLIDMIETRVRGWNLASYMMYQYETWIHNDRVSLYPASLTKESAGYWYKYYDINKKNPVTDVKPQDVCVDWGFLENYKP